jgi:hypothetical protein
MNLEASHASQKAETGSMNRLLETYSRLNVDRCETERDAAQLFGLTVSPNTISGLRTSHRHPDESTQTHDF